MAERPISEAAKPRTRWVRYLYLASTGLIALWMGITGTSAVLGADFLVSRIAHLGYPESFALLLGLAKLSELAALTLPVPRRLREWAYAGSTFETLAATFAYLAVGAPVGDVVVPLIILAVVQTSFWSWIATRQAIHVTPKLLLPGAAAAQAFDPATVQDKTFVKLYRTLHVTPDILHPADRLPEAASLDPDEDVFVVGTGASAFGVPLRTLAYHHLAQGVFDGQPVLITFCPVCNSGVQFDPRVDGEILRLVVGGVHRGTMIMQDEASGSFWDHMTGECLWGRYAGRTLAILGAHRILLACELTGDLAALPIAVPRLPLWQRLVRRMQNGHTWRALPEGKFFPGFRESIAFEDDRLPELAMGVDIWSDQGAVFYPLDTIWEDGPISDDTAGHQVTIRWDPARALPVVAFDMDQASQAYVFTRWYGFAQTFPGCDIYMPSKAGSSVESVSDQHRRSRTATA